MSTPHPAPGYYPDPASNNAIRYWDGQRWAEDHRGGYAPSSTSPAGTATGAPSPYADPAPWAQPEQQPYGQQQPSYGQPSYGQPSYGQPSTAAGNPYAAGGYPATTWQPPGAPPSGPYGSAVSGRRRSPVIALAVVAAVVLLVVVGIVAAVRTASRPPEAVGTVAVGTPLDGDVPSGGSWPLALTISTAGPYVISAVGDGDLTLELFDTDSSIAENDDGGGVVTDRSLDPLLLVYLEPGEYVVDVGTYDDDGSASATVEVTAPTDAVELTVGSTDAVTVPADGYWVGYVRLDDERDLTVDVRAEDPAADLVMAVGTDGETERVDDRESGDPSSGNVYDPYLETGSTSYAVVVIGDRFSSSGTGLTGTIVID